MTPAIADLRVQPTSLCTPRLTDTKFQSTLRETVNLDGVGLHSGRKTTLTIRPAASGAGIVFTDGFVVVPALANYVIDTSRGTTLGFNGVSFKTIEHVVGALNGLGIDNALVEIDGPETPAMDGSAKELVEAIQSAGTVTLDEPKRVINIDEPICVRAGDSFILAVPADEFRITYVLNYDHPLIGSQTASFCASENDFAVDIAPARTFVLYEEVADLLDRQLARGGSVENVIVLWRDHISSALRFEDELVRHKMLDMIGDFSLCGARLNAEVLAVRSGHSLNVEFAKAILKL